MSVNKLLLDTNSYFRLAENIKPLLGCEFGKGDKVQTSKVVEDIIYMWKYLDDLPDNFHSEYKHNFPV